MQRQAFIDVHSHCFVTMAHADPVVRGLNKLRDRGLKKMVVAGLVNTHLDAAIMGQIISASEVRFGDPNYHEAEDLLALTQATDQVLLPFVDTTSLWDVLTLAGYIDRGFKGVKGIYLPDNDNDLGVMGVGRAFGLNPAQYQKREWEIFAFAEAHDLPLLYHMDARRYGEIMVALLEDFPRVRVDFAHFGIGRKAFGKILDRYPNVFTDFASLLPHMHADPCGYRDFILHYADRVCFGTDTLLCAVDTVHDYLDMVKALDLPDAIERKILLENPEKFIGPALCL